MCVAAPTICAPHPRLARPVKIMDPRSIRSCRKWGHSQVGGGVLPLEAFINPGPSTYVRRFISAKVDVNDTLLHSAWDPFSAVDGRSVRDNSRPNSIYHSRNLQISMMQWKLSARCTLLTRRLSFHMRASLCGGPRVQLLGDSK